MSGEPAILAVAPDPSEAELQVVSGLGPFQVFAVERGVALVLDVIRSRVP